MATVFDNVRLPEEVEQGAQGGPEFKTTIVAIGNGTEQRNIDWSEAKASWDVSYGVDSPEFYRTVRAFFLARRGKATGFRFKDWSDFEATDELLGLGTSTTGSDGNATFQVIKTYTSGSASYVRVITRLVASTLVVRVNDVLKTEGVHYTADDDTGIITFLNPHRPTTGQEVNADYEFDVPVRFDTDKFTLTMEVSLAAAIGSLPILELRE
jgi:uncharacterized protein (TIGR02217 family)